MKIVIDRSDNSSGGLVVKAISKSIDTRGMSCPYPSFEAVRAINPLKAGEILEVVTDSKESALESIPSVCLRRKWEYAVLQEGQALWQVRIRKS